jgi:hypothetical protein
MKKVIGLLSLALLSSSLYATRITLKDGNCVDVPDHLRVENDLGADAVVYETIGWIDGCVTSQHSLPKSQDLLITNCHVKDEVKVVVGNKEYVISHPTISTYRSQMAYHYDVNYDITSEFTYKLSALIEAAVKKSFAPATHVTVNEKQETVLWIDKSLKN